MKQGVIIQGPVNFYKEIADHYSKFNNVVWATWNDESITRLDYIRNKGIEVILVEKPKVFGYMNVNMQVKSTFAGVSYLEDKVDEILKVRSDTIITNLDKLLPKLKNKQLSFMATCKTGVRKDLTYDLVYYHNSHDYPADNVIYGKIEDLKMMFDFQIDETLPIPPEALITWNYMTNKGIEFKLDYQTMIDSGISFFLQECLDENVEINWLKKEVNLIDWYKDKTVYDW
jgi:hypothetical protein|tara:strand:- start:1304 stop:1990 length:687 start_codon:yes stop_codon:yes gene_type:complete